MKTPNYDRILADAQEYISKNYGRFLIVSEETEKYRALFKKHIETYLSHNHPAVLDAEGVAIIDELYEDMRGYGFLAKYLRHLEQYPDIEEININRWDSVVLKHSDGTCEYLKDKFHSPQQALDIVRRIVEAKEKQFDSAMPYAETYVKQNVRFTAYMPEIIPKGYGAAAFIRIVRTGDAANYTFVPDTLSEQMERFLYACVEYKVSALIAGEQGSGKTSMLNHILVPVSSDKRVAIIEEGSPELGGLDRYDANGRLQSQYVSFMTRPNKQDDEQDFTQNKLLEGALRGDFDYIVPGEMRSKEAYTAAEAANTGAGVFSSIHSSSARLTYVRCQELMKKAVDYSENSLTRLAVEAFPIVVYMMKGHDNVRRVMEILEGERYTSDDNLQCRTLYQFKVEDNTEVDGKIKTVGSFQKVRGISQNLQDLFLNHGAPASLVNSFAKEG